MNQNRKHGVLDKQIRINNENNIYHHSIADNNSDTWTEHAYTDGKCFYGNGQAPDAAGQLC